jgi:hypothetical protein
VALACASVSAQSQQPQTSQAPQINRNQWFSPFQGHQSQSGQLAHQYAVAEKADEKRDIRKKLSDALSQEFDQHIKEQQKELEDLDKQIANLRSILKKRLDAKATIVERRTEQLIQEAEGLGWTVPRSGRSDYGQNALFAPQPAAKLAPANREAPKQP